MSRKSAFKSPKRPKATRPHVTALQAATRTIRTEAATVARWFIEAAHDACACAQATQDSAQVAQTLLQPLAQVYHMVDTTLPETLAHHVDPTSPQPACTPGCFWCCRLHVEVTPHEALLIAEGIQANYPPEMVGSIRQRLQEEVDAFAARPASHKMIRTDSFCAFLTNQGTCSIYPVRPLACRKYLSASAEECQDYFEAHGARTTKASLHLPSLEHLTLIVDGAMVLALQQAPFPSGAQTTYEMQSAVLRALETPDAALRFVQGEDIFAGCELFVAQRDPAELRQLAQLVQLMVPARPQKA